MRQILGLACNYGAWIYRAWGWAGGGDDEPGRKVAGGRRCDGGRVRGDPVGVRSVAAAIVAEVRS